MLKGVTGLLKKIFDGSIYRVGGTFVIIGLCLRIAEFYLIPDFAHLAMITADHFLLLGLILIIYERYIHENFRKLISSTIIDSILLKKDALQSFSREKREEGIRNLLCHEHGEDLGKAFYNLSLNEKRLNNRKVKENFSYKISLTPSPARPSFFQAFFQIEFDALLTGEELKIENVAVKNGFDFDDWMNSLNRKSGTFYRYILLTEQHLTLDESTFKVANFNVTYFSDSKEVVINYDYRYKRHGTKHLVVHFEPRSEDDKERIKMCQTKKCRFKLSIETLVDKKILAFPIKLKYPVKNFSAIITASNETGISSMDMIDIVNSRSFNKERVPPTHIQSTSGTANGWVIPDSGLVFVWQIRSDQASQLATG